MWRIIIITTIISMFTKIELKSQSWEWAVPPTFDDIKPFSNNRAVIRQGGKYGFINMKGEIIIPAIYSDARNFDKYGARVRLTPKQIRRNKDSNLYSTNANGAPENVVGNDYNWGIIDSLGNFIIQPQYYYISDCYENRYYLGKLKIDKRDRKGYKKQKSYLLDTKTSNVSPKIRNYKNSYKYVIRNGRIVKKLKSHHINHQNESSNYKVKRENDRMYIIENSSLKVIMDISTLNQNTYFITDYYLAVLQGGKYGLINLRKVKPVDWKSVIPENFISSPNSNFKKNIKRIAIISYNNLYNNSMLWGGELHSVKTDALDIKNVLETYYGFEVILLANSTKDEFTSFFQSKEFFKIQNSFDEKSQLILLHIGHGYDGNIIFKDSNRDILTQLTSKETEEILNNINCNNFLSVFHACFSVVICNEIDFYKPYYSIKDEKRVFRKFLASNENQTVHTGGSENENSPFIRKFLELLLENVQDTGSMSFNEIYTKLQYLNISPHKCSLNGDDRNGNANFVLTSKVLYSN